jgi:hypothetical protein
LAVLYEEIETLGNEDELDRHKEQLSTDDNSPMRSRSRLAGIFESSERIVANPEVIHLSAKSVSRTSGADENSADPSLSAFLFQLRE